MEFKINKEPILTIDEYGTKRWKLDGKYHRIDGPAFINENDYKVWYINGFKYSSYEEWFQALTPDQQYNYLWHLDE